MSKNEKKKQALAIRPQFSKRKPNKKTLDAHKECLEGKGVLYDSVEEFWEDMGINDS